jgi:hypothetical protein
MTNGSGAVNCRAPSEPGKQVDGKWELRFDLYISQKHTLDNKLYGSLALFTAYFFEWITNMIYDLGHLSCHIQCLE